MSPIPRWYAKAHRGRVVGLFDWLKGSPSGPSREELEADMASALRFIMKGDQATAVPYLERVAAATPQGWTARREVGDEVFYAAWDIADFMTYCMRTKAPDDTRKIIHDELSFSLAHFILGCRGVETGDFEKAARHLDRSLALEPERPDTWAERGLVHMKLGQTKEALEAYRRGSLCRPWDPTGTAKALRGMGVALIDLKDLDQAAQCLERSLELDPKSDLARRELGYIAQLRDGTAPKLKHQLFKPGDPGAPPPPSS